MSFATDPAGWAEQITGGAQRVFLRTSQGREISYAALREQSGRIACALLRRGVLPGERIAVQVDKCAEAVLLYVACLRLGAGFVPLNLANTPNEVDFFLRDSRPRVAVIRPQDRQALEPLATRTGIALETLGESGEGAVCTLAAGGGG